jgi:hypothetical protein
MIRAAPTTTGGHVRLKAELRYDADPHAVFAMLTDTGFQEAKLEATKALSHEVDVALRSDGGAVITSRRTMPTDRVPDMVRSAVGQTLEIVQVEEWGPAGADGGRSGTLHVEIRKAPVRLTGTLQLRAAGQGTLELVEGDLKAAVPLIGGKIERSAEPAVMAAIQVEEQTGRAWLAAR